MEPPTLVATLQAAYFLITGIWPLVHLPSFMAVTGPKHDRWLVRTAGVLITAIGVALAVAAWRDDVDPAMIVLAIAAAVGLAAIDVVYVAKRVISPIYLGDALCEAALVTGWLIALRPW
jgi:hypothetical protein